MQLRKNGNFKIVALKDAYATPQFLFRAADFMVKLGDDFQFQTSFPNCSNFSHRFKNPHTLPFAVPIEDKGVMEDNPDKYSTWTQIHQLLIIFKIQILLNVFTLNQNKDHTWTILELYLHSLSVSFTCFKFSVSLLAFVCFLCVCVLGAGVLIPNGGCHWRWWRRRWCIRRGETQMRELVHRERYMDLKEKGEDWLK